MIWHDHNIMGLDQTQHHCFCCLPLSVSKSFKFCHMKAKKKTPNNPKKQKLDCLKPFKNTLKEGFLTSALQPANLRFSRREPCGDIFSWMTNMNRLIGCEEDPQTKRHSLECAGCRGTKGGGGEVSPLCYVKPIEKSVSQEDQISANPQCREAERKHK